jgi:histidinol-phosphate aminotransferase
VIANPNAPTSIGLQLSEIRRILDAHLDNVVLIDEAYVDFGGESAVGLIPEYPNLLVVRTLSKSCSLAGMRIGFAAGSAELIEGLNRIKNSFNSYTVDRLAIVAGAAAIRDREYFEETLRKVILTRERIAAALRDLGFEMPDSSANFIFAAHPKYPAQKIFSYLKLKGILVRYFNSPGIDNYLRISIGTDEEMDTLVSELREMIM